MSPVRTAFELRICLAVDIQGRRVDLSAYGAGVILVGLLQRKHNMLPHHYWWGAHFAVIQLVSKQSHNGNL